jgi:membrane protein implicated in regulation of membrane protease activity
LKNSTIVFLAAAVVLVWFGSEAFLGQEICATSCISLAGTTSWEDAVVVAILPVLLLIGALKLRSKEKIEASQRKAGISSGSRDESGPGEKE